MAEWTAEETAIAESNLHATTEEVMALLPGRSARAVQRKMQILRQQRRLQVNRAISEAAMNPPIEVDLSGRVRELESQLASVSERMKWVQHAEQTEDTGGVLTLRASDHHYGDLNHLMSCGLCLEGKAIEVFKRFNPDRINIVAGDDWIAGKGIFRTQDREVVTSDTNEQCQIGAMHARYWLQRIRESGITAPIQWHIMRGNHDYNEGTSLTEYLFLLMRDLCGDIPDVKFIMHWDRNILNLAAEGKYMVMIRHGTGHSKISPNSASFVEATKDEILMMMPDLKPGEHIRRVISGHTHWASLGLERVAGALVYDTTGGLQRNTRVKLGANQRPIGWIVYVSPRGMKDNIIQPIMLSPDRSVYMREFQNPHLANDNRENAAKRLREYRELMEDRGDFAKNEFAGIQEGRW